MRMFRRATINTIKAGGYTLEYTGAYTQKEITSSGVRYMLYTFTSSGVLTLTGKASGDIFLCGGGAKGVASGGGGGGYTFETRDVPIKSGALTIGAGNSGNTIYGEYTANGGTGKNGASGGGGGVSGSPPTAGGTGQGTTTRPFADAVNFTSLPCAGGGGGDITSDDSSKRYRGGNGGSNGSSGNPSVKSSSDTVGGNGGSQGGGKGGYYDNLSGGNATYYGSGGGGPTSPRTGGGYGSAGNGYQGVAYIRIPIAA